MNDTQQLDRLRRAALLKRLQQGGASARQPGADTPVVPVGRDRPLPLSWAQKRLYFIHRLDPTASVAYHMPAGLRLVGALDTQALRTALDRIVERHEVLRTRFVERDGEPFQVIDAPQGFALVVEDLCVLSEEAREHAVARAGADEAAAPFDLERGPLIRGRLLQLRADEHVLFLTQHHIVSDQWSIGVLVREFAALYRAGVEGSTAGLMPLRVQYADYAAWQQGWLHGTAVQAQVAFWKRQLEGAPALLNLPTDRPRPAVQRYRGRTAAMQVPVALTTALRELARRHGTTLFTTLFAGLAVLLSRLSEQNDIVIGSPFANRQRPEIEPLLGFFANTLALRVRVDTEASVGDLLAAAKTATIESFAHHELPFEQVVDALNPARDLGYNPIFQVVLGLNNLPGSVALVLPGLSLSSAAPRRETSPFDLGFSLTEQCDSIHGEVDYSSDLFDAGSIGRLVAHWLTVLQALTENDASRVGDLRLLDAAQRNMLLHDLNRTHVAYPQAGLVHREFQAQAARTPAAIALSDAQSCWTYAELDAAANRFAHRLLDAVAIAPDTPIALVAPRSAALVIAQLGVLKAGAAYVPLDPLQPAERLRAQLEDCAPSVVIVDTAAAALLAGHGVRQLPLTVHDDAGPSHAPDRSDLTSRHLAYVMYTSGSTGKPKGVMIETPQCAASVGQQYVCAVERERLRGAIARTRHSMRRPGRSGPHCCAVRACTW